MTPFSLYVAERRVAERIYPAALWLVRAYVLTKYRAGDVRRRWLA